MALPIIPLALVAGAVALARNVQVLPVMQPVEDSLDMVPEGFAAQRDAMGKQINSSYRWKRVVRFGKSGRGVEIDASAIGRIKFRKL